MHMTIVASHPLILGHPDHPACAQISLDPCHSGLDWTLSLKSSQGPSQMPSTPTLGLLLLTHPSLLSRLPEVGCTFGPCRDLGVLPSSLSILPVSSREVYLWTIKPPGWPWWTRSVREGFGTERENKRKHMVEGEEEQHSWELGRCQQVTCRGKDQWWSNPLPSHSETSRRFLRRPEQQWQAESPKRGWGSMTYRLNTIKLCLRLICLSLSVFVILLWNASDKIHPGIH